MAGTDFGSAMTRSSFTNSLLAGETEWKPILMAIASILPPCIAGILKPVLIGRFQQK
jgi:hypothetical protein